jgi:hypothetical protein
VAETDHRTAMKSVIELHDSCVVGVVQSNGTIAVRFGPAYVHWSDCCPALDPGSVWVQDIDLVISEFVLKSRFIELPQVLDDGALSVDNLIFENIVPLPFDMRGSVRFSARSMSGEVLVIHGSKATFVLIGESRYVEPFPGNQPTKGQG